MDCGKERKPAGRGRQRSKRKRAPDWHRKWDTRKRTINAWGSSSAWRRSQERLTVRNAIAVRKEGAAGGGVPATKGKGRTCAWAHSICALGN